VGKPLAFGRLLVELLALLPAPDRSGQPAPRNCFGPHPACPYDRCYPIDLNNACPNYRTLSGTNVHRANCDDEFCTSYATATRDM
jgi:hypothetical protein